MIYTEYFVTGTQPTDKCPLHPSSSLMDRLAGLFGAHSEPPVPPEQAGVPVSEHRGTSGVSAATPSAESSEDIHGGTATDETPKKRGFWSKVFGKKDKREEDKNKKEDRKKSE